MSRKIDSLMNAIAQCRADIVADRMMIEALLRTHDNPALVKEAWKQLHGAHVRDRDAVERPENIDRAMDAEQDESFAVWRVRLSLAIAQKQRT